MLEIADVMETDVVTVTPEASIMCATEILMNNNITGLPVVDKKNKLLGIVSEKDLLLLTYGIETGQHHLSECKTVKDVMTPYAFTFDINDHLSDVCKSLMDGNYRRVPILKKGKLVGIISRKDLLACKILGKAR